MLIHIQWDEIFSESTFLFFYTYIFKIFWCRIIKIHIAKIEEMFVKMPEFEWHLFISLCWTQVNWANGQINIAIVLRSEIRFQKWFLPTVFYFICFFKSEIPYARKTRHTKETNMRYFLTSFEGSNKWLTFFRSAIHNWSCKVCI